MLNTKPANSQRSWYLVVTKPQSEIKALSNLERQGYECYLPLAQVNRRRNGKHVKRTEAYFPRYLFIKLNKETDNWAPIRSTIGVAGMVRFGGVPAEVPDVLVESLKQNETSSGLQEIESRKLIPGQQIEVVAGAFEGAQAIFVKKTSTERVAVLLDVVGKNTQVSMSIHELNIV